MPILSLIIITILTYIIVFYKGTMICKFYKIFTIDCVVRLFFVQGYFIKIGNMEIGSSAGICDMVLLLYAIMILASNEQLLKSKAVVSGLCVFAISLISIFFELIFPYDGLLLPKQDAINNWDMYIADMCSMRQYYPSMADYVKPIIDLLRFLIIAVAFKIIFNLSYFLKSYMRVISIAKYGIYYGWIEFFIKNVVNNLTITYDFSEIMFGVNERSVATEAFSKGGIFYSLQGFCREPSHFNIFIFSVVMLMILGFFITENLKDSIHINLSYSNLTIISGISLLLMTGGFSAVWLIVILSLGSIILQIRRMSINITSILFKYRGAILLGMCCCVILLFIIGNNDYFIGRLQDAVMIVSFISNTNGSFAGLAWGGNEGIGSTIARFISIYEGINIFLNRTFLGLGYKIQEVHSDTITYLVNMGLIGYYFFLRFLVSSIHSFKYDKLYLGLVFVIGGLPMIISSYGLCVYWLLFIEGSMIARKENKLLL